VHDRTNTIQNTTEIDRQPDHDQEPTQQVWSITVPRPGDESISRNANAPGGALPSLRRMESGLKWRNSVDCSRSMTGRRRKE